MRARPLYWRFVALVGNQTTRNGILSMAQAILTILVYFLVMRKVVAIMGLEALGLWSITMSLVAFTRMLDFGGAGVLARLVATASDDEQRQAQFIDSTAIASTLAFGLLALAGHFVLNPILLDTIKPQLHTQASILLFGLLTLLPLNAFGQVHQGALDGIARADIRAGIAILALVLYATATHFLIQRHGLMALVYAQFLQHGFTSLASRWLLIQRIASLRTIPMKFCRDRFQESASFAVRLQFAGIPMAVFDSVCRLLIGRSAGLDMLGLYEIASKFAGSSRTVLQAFVSPIVPEFARLMSKDQDAARRLHGKRQPGISTAAMLLSLGQIIALPIVSYVMLERIDARFILVGSALSFAWGITSIGLVTQLYARAAGKMKHAVIGQWSLLAAGFMVVPAASLLGNPLWMLISPAAAIMFGHLLAYLGEVRYFNLTIYGEGSTSLMMAMVYLLTLVTAMVAVASIILIGL